MLLRAHDPLWLRRLFEQVTEFASTSTRPILDSQLQVLLDAAMYRFYAAYHSESRYSWPSAAFILQLNRAALKLSIGFRSSVRFA